MIPHASETVLEGESKFREENLPYLFFIWMTAASDLVYHNTFNVQKIIMMVSLRQFFIAQWCFTEG